MAQLTSGSARPLQVGAVVSLSLTRPPGLGPRPHYERQKDGGGGTVKVR